MQNRFSSYDTRFNSCIDLCLKLYFAVHMLYKIMDCGQKQKFVQLNYKVYIIEIWVKKKCF